MDKVCKISKDVPWVSNVRYK